MKKLRPVLVVLGLLAVVQSAVADDPGTNRGIMDLAPTFLDLPGLPVPKEMQGASWKG